MLIGLSKMVSCTKYLSMKYITRHTTVPIILKLMWTMATLFASLFTPIDERSEVTQVPMFSPMIIGIAIPKVMEPVSESA